MMIKFAPKNDQASRQLSDFVTMAARLNCPIVGVVGTHHSKSLELPVMSMDFPEVHIACRDNFHDVNVLVRAKKTIDLPLSFFYPARPYSWYQEQLERKRGYSLRDWSDEELADPRILRVKRHDGNGWSEVKGDEKDRWNARASSTEWYSRDWSSGKLLVEGPVPFNDQTQFFVTGHAYAEGMNDTELKAYHGPTQAFINCVDGWPEAEKLIRGVLEHLQNKHES